MAFPFSPGHQEELARFQSHRESSTVSGALLWLLQDEPRQLTLPTRPPL